MPSAKSPCPNPIKAIICNCPNPITCNCLPIPQHKFHRLPSIPTLPISTSITSNSPYQLLSTCNTPLHSTIIEIDSVPPYSTLPNMWNQGQVEAQGKGQGEAQGQGQGITFAPACMGTYIIDADYKLGYLRKALKDGTIESQRVTTEDGSCPTTVITMMTQHI